MNKQFLSILTILALLLGFSVSAWSDNAAGLNQYSAIQVGKLALDQSKWKDLGYKSEQEWKASIANINTAFQQALQASLPRKQLTFADRGAKTGLAVTFSKVMVDHGYAYRGPWGSISADVTIKDVKLNKIVYQGNISKQAGTFSLELQLQNAAREIAVALAEILIK